MSLWLFSDVYSVYRIRYQITTWYHPEKDILTPLIICLFVLRYHRKRFR
ncbi:hypothetical protein NPIL_57881, partial [Nephila pilipes]